MIEWLVVGAGVAGSVIASRLAATGASVIVAEQGGNSTPGNDLFEALEVTERVRSTPLVRRVDGGPLVPYTAGIGLGGGSAINGSIVSLSGPFAHSHSLPVETDRQIVRATSNGQRIDAWSAYGRQSSVKPLLGAEVDQVLVDGSHCVGIRCSDGSEILARRVVVCAGALGSPLLLLRSGLDMATLGHGLQDHPAVMVRYRRRAGSARSERVIAAVERRGPLQIMRLDRVSSVDDGTAGVIVMMMRPRSSGRVAIDAAGSPDINFSLGSSERDVMDLADGVRAVLADSLDGELVTAPVLGEEVTWVRNELAMTTPVVMHPTSSCAMGATVDRLGRLHGVDNLFVADASVFPWIPSVNPMLPTVQLAETLVDRWIAAGLA